jgi:hypothetical protein
VAFGIRRASTRAGFLIAKGQKDGTISKPGGGRQSSKALSRSTTMLKPQKLEDLGITRDQSSDWQKLAAVPEKQFELELQKPGVPTTEQTLRSVHTQFVSEKFRNII